MWSPTRAARTNGLSEAPPDPKKLEKGQCSTIVRSILGSLMYAARGTRADQRKGKEHETMPYFLTDQYRAVLEASQIHTKAAQEKE